MLVAGCKSDPLASGAWSITLVDVANDTCGVLDEDVGVGVATSATVSWDKDTLVIDGFGLDTTWDAGASTWTSGWDADLEDGACTVNTEHASELTVVDEQTFTI